MTPLGGVLDKVAGVLQDVAAEVLQPLFARRDEMDPRDKAPGELVTSGDIEAERMLARRLNDLLPGVPIIGEEATATDASLPTALLAEAPRVWLVDALDGTANFVAGSPDWAVMVALVERGITVASWMWRPVGRRLFVAERGGGAWADDRQIVCPPAPTAAHELTGAVLSRFLDPATRSTVASNAYRFAAITAGSMCAGVEYPMIAEGDQHFVLFQRTLPWDHAPGVLFVEEAGGWARRLDGSEYRPAQTSAGLLVSADEPSGVTVHDQLLGDLENERS